MTQPIVIYDVNKRGRSPAILMVGWGGGGGLGLGLWGGGVALGLGGGSLQLVRHGNQKSV